MGMDKIEIIAVVFAVLVVFCGIGAGIGGLVIEEATGNHAQALAEKTGAELVKLTAADGTSVLAYRTADGQYINAESMLDAYKGYTEDIVLYFTENDSIIGEASAGITFYHGTGLWNSGAGKALKGLIFPNKPSHP